MSPRRRGLRRPGRFPSARSRGVQAAAGGVAVAVVAAVATWLAVGSAGSSHPRTATTSTAVAATQIGPLALTAARLERLVGTLGQAVYWAGPGPSRRYGLTRTSNGSVFLRYLPAGATAAEKKRFLTIGTYPFKDAFAATEALARKPGAVSTKLAGGGLVYYRKSHPVSVYVVYPGLDYQIEVYDPSAAVALRLALSGRVRRVP